MSEAVECSYQSERPRRKWVLETSLPCFSDISKKIFK